MNRRIVQPRLDPLRLKDLVEASGDALTDRTDIEGLSVTGADISGADISHGSFSECRLDDITAHETDFRGTTFADVEFERLNAPVLLASRSRFKDVTVDASRVGSAELFDASLNSVHISSSRLGFVNLRGAVLTDVLFTDCTIDELDLGDAQATRVAFRNTTVNTLDVTRAALVDVDLRDAGLRSIVSIPGLRGATMSEVQVTQLAESFAAQLGIFIDN